MRLIEGLLGLTGLTPPVIRPEVTSMGAWYGFKPWVDCDQLGVKRCYLVDALKAEGIEVDEPGSPSLHELPLFSPDRFPIGPWPKAALDPRAFPAAERYNRGTLSLPPLTGPEDEQCLAQTVRVFSKVWKDLDASEGQYNTPFQ
jgi:hypothetical protein